MSPSGSHATLRWREPDSKGNIAIFRYYLLASALLIFYVALSFTVALIFDGTAAIATFRDDLKFRFLFGVVWLGAG